MTREQELLRQIEFLKGKLNEETKFVIAYKNEREDLLETNWNMAKKLAAAEQQIKSCLADLKYTKKELIDVKTKHQILKIEYQSLKDYCFKKETSNG